MFLAGNASYDAPNFWHQTWRRAGKGKKSRDLALFITEVAFKHQSDLSLSIRADLELAADQKCNDNEAICFYHRSKLRNKANSLIVMHEEPYHLYRA